MASYTSSSSSRLPFSPIFLDVTAHLPPPPPPSLRTLTTSVPKRTRPYRSNRRANSSRYRSTSSWPGNLRSRRRRRPPRRRRRRESRGSPSPPAAGWCGARRRGWSGRRRRRAGRRWRGGVVEPRAAHGGGALEHHGEWPSGGAPAPPPGRGARADDGEAERRGRHRETVRARFRFGFLLRFGGKRRCVVFEFVVLWGLHWTANSRGLVVTLDWT